MFHNSYLEMVNNNTVLRMQTTYWQWAITSLSSAASHAFATNNNAASARKCTSGSRLMNARKPLLSDPVSSAKASLQSGTGSRMLLEFV